MQPITDPEFSAAVQLVRRSATESSDFPRSGHATFGAKGLLEGTGDDCCRLSGIPYTEAVSVGDEVVSADINGVHGPRLYFGRVVTAEFSDGGQWNIEVEPAFAARNVDHVAVVQQRINRPGD